MITSTSNDKIKHVTQLVRNTKARRKEGVFVAEGTRFASEIPEDKLVECFVSEDYLKTDPDLSVFGYDTEPVEVSSAVFGKMSDTDNPQGILCVCRQDQHDLNDFLSKRKGAVRLLVLEGIQDPGNLGTMIRTAEGAGFDAVIADENTVDAYNPKVIRSTMGSIFRVPFISVSDLPGTVEQLKNAGITVYAAHLDGKRNYREEEYGDRIAFLIGNEGNGLSEEITKKADILVKIPMQGKLESLNAAIAAALLMYR
ncbi:MAG: RNA methyltransferase [Lachnospiraceae bacterium]|nr:RNA methyltransferase [Lachnospiraceae bacterium]